MTHLGDFLLLVFVFAVLLIGYGIIKSANRKGLTQDEINLKEYQKRKDIGGENGKSNV